MNDSTPNRSRQVAITGHRDRWPLICLLIALLAVTGCRKAPNGPDPAEIAKYQAQFLLAEEPADVMGVAELHKRLLSEEGDESAENARVVVVGSIGGVPNPWGAAEPNYPWSEGQARFFLSDIGAAAEIAEQTKAHTHEDGRPCPFCSKAARRDIIAMVNFCDENKRSIRIDTRQLLKLSGGETVVLQGTASLLGEGKAAYLVIDADGIYVRKPD